MRVITAPERADTLVAPTIFLAGSIEGDTAAKWQTHVIEALRQEQGTILNPRRAAWDNSWSCTITNPVFKEQVEWELSGIERSDIVAFYFDPGTKSPITLLELGLALAMKKKTLIACPDTFWRKGNVDITATRYGVPVLSSLEELIEALRAKNPLT